MNGIAEQTSDAAETMDERKVSTARWVLENFDHQTPIGRSAQRVIAAYLVGKPLPTPKGKDLTEADV